jgi:hypothetical protein
MHVNAFGCRLTAPDPLAVGARAFVRVAQHPHAFLGATGCSGPWPWSSTAASSWRRRPDAGQGWCHRAPLGRDGPRAGPPRIGTGRCRRRSCASSSAYSPGPAGTARQASAAGRCDVADAWGTSPDAPGCSRGALSPARPDREPHLRGQAQAVGPSPRAVPPDALRAGVTAGHRRHHRPPVVVRVAWGPEDVNSAMVSQGDCMHQRGTYKHHRRHNDPESGGGFIAHR